MRLHLFEFEDLKWFPDVIRRGGTDYLRYFLIHSELYKPVINLLHQAMVITGQTKVVDLCSGGGGYIEKVHEQLNILSPGRFTVLLTDKFPNSAAYELIKDRSNGSIDYCPDPVDVFDVPPKLQGFRVLFSAVHHFKPYQVKAILQDAVNTKTPIAFFDGGEKNVLAVLGLMIIHPLVFFFCTPLFKPFKLSRLFFTYLVPLIPLYTIWDGVVSILRMYRPEELAAIAATVDSRSYTWKYGKTRNRFGIKSTYLIGYHSENKPVSLS